MNELSVKIDRKSKKYFFRINNKAAIIWLIDQHGPPHGFFFAYMPRPIYIPKKAYLPGPDSKKLSYILPIKKNIGPQNWLIIKTNIMFPL